jgi:hypothetical protein
VALLENGIEDEKASAGSQRAPFFGARWLFTRNFNEHPVRDVPVSQGVLPRKLALQIDVRFGGPRF